MLAEFTVIIPARYGAARLPGKPLKRIGNESLIENAFNTACKSRAMEVYVATDDKRIVEEVMQFGGKAILTSNKLISGTDRLHEAALNLDLPYNRIIVNLQGDEYNFNPDHINLVADMLDDNQDASITTLCKDITSTEELVNKNVVKVIVDQSGYALYFSRSAIPWSNPENIITGAENVRGHRHIGIYAYRAGFLNDFVNLTVPEIEKSESLEQLRAIYYGYKIHVQRVDEQHSIDINSEEDLSKARKLAANQ